MVQDANAKLTTSVYFSNRNLPEVTIDAMGFRTTYAFDQQSRLVSTRDANGGYVTNVYDVVGRLALVQNQLGENARQFGYDLAGRTVTMADAANRVRTYTYDAAGQTTATRFPDGKIATYAYDRLGRRTTMSDWGGTSTYSFDAIGRQVGQTDATGFVQAYGYDANGNRTSLNLVGTGLFTYTYDSLNRLATARKPGNALYTMAYDADSRRTTMMLGNGTTRKYQFDNRSQLTTQIELSGATPICTIVDGYDAVGNRVTRSLDGNPITWTYDDLYRLTGQQKAGQVCTYTMDGVGNLRTMWEGGAFPKTFTFNAADRLVTMMQGTALTTYAYTGYGALASEITGKDLTAYAYSGQDQLIGVTDPKGVLSTYSFDGDGMRRTAQEGNVAPTTMVWDGSDYLLLNEPTGNRVVLTLESEIVACGTRDLLTDPLGSLVKEISAGASLSALFEYYPYGTPAAGKANTPFAFVAAYGYYTDTTDRDYVRARELMKSVGRWMQVDPLWPEERAFGYANWSPSSWSDHTGLQCREKRLKMLKRSGVYVRVCESHFLVPYVDWPPDLLMTCVPNPLDLIKYKKVPCFYGIVRVFLADGDKDLINQIGVIGAIACFRLADPKLIAACELAIAGIGLWIALCTKPSGDACIQVGFSTCPPFVGIWPGCCDGYGFAGPKKSRVPK